MKVCVCHREPRGLGFKVGKSDYTWFCSRQCLDGWKRMTDRGKKKMDLTRDEVTAIQFAAEQAGQYLDSIGKTDLATMTADEWMTLNETVFMSASWKLSEIISIKEVPF